MGLLILSACSQQSKDVFFKSLMHRSCSQTGAPGVGHYDHQDGRNVRLSAPINPSLAAGAHGPSHSSADGQLTGIISERSGYNWSMTPTTLVLPGLDKAVELLGYPSCSIASTTGDTIKLQ